MNDYKPAEEEKDELVAELRENGQVSDISVSHNRTTEYDVAFRHDGRDLPAGLLQFVGGLADLRIEGTDGDNVDCIALV